MPSRAENVGDVALSKEKAGSCAQSPECPGAASSGPGFSLCSEWSSRKLRDFTHGGSPGCAFFPDPTPTDPPSHRPIHPLDPVLEAAAHPRAPTRVSRR